MMSRVDYIKWIPLIASPCSLGYHSAVVAPTLESNNICSCAQLVQGDGALLQEDLYHPFKNSHSA